MESFIDIGLFVMHCRVTCAQRFSGSFQLECVCLNRLQLHGAIYRPDSFVLMLRYCANLKAIKYESKTLNVIVADKLHCVIVA